VGSYANSIFFLLKLLVLSSLAFKFTFMLLSYTLMEGNHGPTFNNGFILYDFGVRIHVKTYVLISFIYAFGCNFVVHFFWYLSAITSSYFDYLISFCSGYLTIVGACLKC